MVLYMKIYQNNELSSEQYHGDREYISSSGLKLLLTSPKEFHDRYVLNLESGTKSSPALIQGCHLHSSILEPEKVDVEYSVFPGSIKRGKDWEKFLIENDNKVILTQAQAALTDRLVKNFNTAEVVINKGGFTEPVKIASFYAGGVAEESVMGELDGVKVKVRFDYRKNFETFGSINDLKTTSEYINSLDKVKEICEKMHYDLSASLYIDMAEKAFGVPHDFYFTFLSKADGTVKIFRASKEFLEKGRLKYKRALELLKSARKTGLYFTQDIEEV